MVGVHVFFNAQSKPHLMKPYRMLEVFFTLKTLQEKLIWMMFTFTWHGEKITVDNNA